MHISEVCLEIFEVTVLGHSFHRTQVALKIWRTSLVGNHPVYFTQKWWLTVGWLLEKKKRSKKENFTDCEISEVNNDNFKHC